MFQSLVNVDKANKAYEIASTITSCYMQSSIFRTIVFLKMFSKGGKEISIKKLERLFKSVFKIEGRFVPTTLE